MKFFISYSRSVKTSVAAVIDELAKAGHEVWWDGDIPVIADWWETILRNIEASQVLIFMISEKSVQSDYCMAELRYADALNKPILPLIIDDCIVDGQPRYPIPAEISAGRVQWLNYDGNVKGMLARINEGCNQINWDFYQPVPQSRPPEPNTGSNSLTKQFQMAVSLAEDGHFDEAIKRLRNVARLESQRLGQLCHQWELRITAYQQIAEYADHKSTLRLARAEWAAYVTEFQDDELFDPFDLAPRLLVNDHSPSLPPVGTQRAASSSSPLPPVETTPISNVSSPRPEGEGTGVRVEPDYLTRLRAFTGNRNADWQPYITTFPDLKIPTMEFCLVPPGTFQMGSDRDAREKPVHLQTITQPCWLAKYPVTNAQWQVAVSAGAVELPEDEDALKWYKDPEMAACPVVGVTWFDAQQFCEWLGCRLPTEAEWEYAARGVESLVYPWGNIWDEQRLIWEKNSGGHPQPVTSKVEGASWVGALHLSGNVWERLNSLYQPYPYQTDDGREAVTGLRTNISRVLRGGSFRNIRMFARAAFRSSTDPSVSDSNAGFRVVAVPHLLDL